MTTIPTSKTTLQKFLLCLNRRKVRNALLTLTLTGLLLLFVAAFLTINQLSALHSFRHNAQNSHSLQDIASLLAHRRGLKAVIDAGDHSKGLDLDHDQINQMLIYSLKPLLHEKRALTGQPYRNVTKLRDCIAINCFDENRLSGESSFNLHTTYIKELLSDAELLLKKSDGWQGTRIEPAINLLINTAFYAEIAGQVRGRLSAYITDSATLADNATMNFQNLQRAFEELQAEGALFNELASSQLIADAGLASYTARNHRHYQKLKEQVDILIADPRGRNSQDFFDAATRFISDISFLRNQVFRHVTGYINLKIEYLNQQLAQIGVAGFILFILLISLLLVRFKAEHEKTKERNLELGFLKKALDQHAIVSMTDPKGNITYINDRFVQISGYQPDELIGKNHRVINSGIHPKGFFKELWNHVHANKPWAGEVCNKRKDGSFYWVYATVLPLFDQDGNLVSIISVRTDITRQKQSEALLQREKEKADAANSAKSDFLANMSHEIRTPMNAVIGMTHLALRSASDDKTLDYLNKIKLSANNLLDIINDILDFSKIEAGKIELENIPFPLADTLQQVVELSQVRANEKKLPVYFNPPSDLVGECIGDPLRISQVLLNLLSNAVKFTNDGYVELDIEQHKLSDEKVLLTFSVRDTGIGVSEEKQKNLFEAFAQEDTSTTRLYGGTGLGLSISQQLTRMMGGQLSVSSIPGEGSCFSFTLTLDVATSQNSNRSLDQLRALYIDDDPIALAAVKRLFEAQGISLHCSDDAVSGYEFVVKQAQSAETALDLVLVDQQMPELDGTSIARKLRAELPSGRVPMITLLTGRDEHDLAVIAQEKLFDAVWLKPVAASEILDSLQDMLRQSHRGLSSTLNQNLKATSIRQILGAKVLIAEDNLINQEVITGLLEPYGLDLTLVNNGSEAVEAVKKQVFDLILMDVQMPVMDGLEASQMICDLGLVKQPPIIAMTANAMESDRQDCFRVGMSDHISKPIDPSRLQMMLYQWLKPEGVALPVVERVEEPIDRPPCYIEGINMSVAFASANKDMALLQRLFRSFIEQYSETDLTQLPGKDLGRQLHTLKGLAGTLGMTELHLLASTLEQEHKKQGDIPDDRLQLVNAEMARLTQAIESCMKEHATIMMEQPDEMDQAADSEGHPAGNGVDLISQQPVLENQQRSRVTEIAANLQRQLNHGDSEAQDSALELMLALQDTPQANAASEILQYADSFDFDKALAILESLEIRSDTDS